MAVPQYWGFEVRDFLDNKRSHRSKNTTNPVALANLKFVFSSKMPHPSYQLAIDPVAFAADLKSPLPTQMTKVKSIQINNSSDICCKSHTSILLTSSKWRFPCSRSDVSLSSDSLVSKPMKAPFVPSAALLKCFVIFTIRLKEGNTKTQYT
jgi:hypothetical protein